MKLATRVRYGVRAMIELAKVRDGKPVSLRKLAENQGVSSKYLEQMATALKHAGLLDSVRGAEGGYKLGKPASEITVWDIYKVLDTAVSTADCVDGPCERDIICSAKELWVDVSKAIEGVLHKHSLGELAEKELKLEAKNPDFKPEIKRLPCSRGDKKI